MAKRRPSGDGMVRKRDDGRWEGRIVVGHKENGESIFRYIYADTQKDLTAKLHQNINAYRGVELTEQSRMTLSEWLDKWLDERMRGTVRSHTLEGYRRDINNHVNPYLGQKPLTRITPADLNDLYTFLLERGRIAKGQSSHPGLSPTTVHGIHTILHHALKTAEAEGLLPANPAGQVMPPKVSNKSKRILNNEQLDTLMTAIRRDNLWHDFFYTELTTGLRRGELCGLKWSDFDSKAGTLKICRTIRSGKGGTLEAGDTKTYAGKRTILLPHSTIQLLKKRKETALTEWIFPDLLNPEKPTHPAGAYRQLKKFLAEAGLPDIRFHDLRHTFATHALAGGVDAKTLSGILGHTKASFTLDTYAHVTGDMQRHAAQVVGDFIQDIL
ncbi:MAG: site-specific integrase [Lawsonibacter sp.]|jgi:integrase|nr:site-specific integrase [Lawsonibacter sp.]